MAIAAIAGVLFIAVGLILLLRGLSDADNHQQMLEDDGK